MTAQIWTPDMGLVSTSKPYSPQKIESAYLIERDGGSRWNLFRTRFVPLPFRAPDNPKMVKVGMLMESRFTIDIVEEDLDNHADWLIVFQIHGKNSWEDEQVGQVAISLRNRHGKKAWYIRVTGDQRWITKKSTLGDLGTDVRHWATGVPLTGPVEWFVRTKTEMKDLSEDDIKEINDPNFAPADGQTSVFWKTPNMTTPVEELYVPGPNYFPVLNEPETGQEPPKFGMYASKSIQSGRQRAYYSGMAVRFSDDEFTRDPIFKFDI